MHVGALHETAISFGWSSAAWNVRIFYGRNEFCGSCESSTQFQMILIETDIENLSLITKSKKSQFEFQKKIFQSFLIKMKLVFFY